ncbi:MAG: hypothetical protein WAT42_06090, partial [Candidatus Nanopelagicales bacterium]
MKKHGLRMLVASTAVAIPLTAAGLAPASASAVPTSVVATSVVATVKAPAKRVSPRVAAIVPASVATG